MKARVASQLTRATLLVWVIGWPLNIILTYFAINAESEILFYPVFLDLAILPFWFIALGHFLLERKRADQESHESNLSPEKREQLKRSQIFDQSYEEVLFDQKEHFFSKRTVPFMVAITIGAIALLAYSVAYGDKHFNFESAGAELQACFLLLKAIIAFASAKYLLGIAASLRLHHLMATGGMLIYQSVFSLLLGVAAFGKGLLQLHEIAHVLQYLAALILALYVVEVVLRFIVGMYADTNEESPAHCSIVSRLNISDSMVDQVQESWSYQFGNDFKETLVQFFRRVGPGLALIFIAAFAIGTSFGLIRPGQQGIPVYFGKYAGAVLEPGFYLKWPWPLSRVHVVDAQRVHSIELGGEDQKVEKILWKEQHLEGEKMYLIPSAKERGSTTLPLELYRIHALLHYRIKDTYEYLFNCEAPEDLIRELAERELTFFAMGSNSEDFFSKDRTEIAKRITRGLQSHLDRLKVGVEILHFALPQFHPPKETVETFEASFSAKYRKEKAINEAFAHKASLDAKSDLESSTILAEARARAAHITNRTLADRSYFDKVSPLQKISGGVFLKRKHLDVLASSLKDMRVIINLSQNKGKVIGLNLEESLEPDVLEMTLDAKKEDDL